MARSALSFEVADLSALARALRDELTRLGRLPGHVELLNMLSRGAGFRNYQHLLRASAGAPGPAARPPEPPVDAALVEKVARAFDASGQLLRWPARANQHVLCLWVLWSRIPAATAFTERQISDLLKRQHSFGDHALLRRALYDYRLVDRTIDGREYRRIEQKPPAELRPLLARIA